MSIWPPHEEKKGSFPGDNSDVTVLTHNSDLLRAEMSYRKLFVKPASIQLNVGLACWHCWHCSLPISLPILPFVFEYYRP